MNNESIEKFTAATVIPSIVISVSFVYLVFKMFAINPIIKVLLFIPILCLVFFTSILIIYYSRILFSASTPLASIIVSAIILLTSAIGNTLYSSNNKTAYMKNCPKDGAISIEFSSTYHSISREGSIGNDWSTIHCLNGIPVSNGSIIEVSAYDDFVITSQFIENDPSINDTGTCATTKHSFLAVVDCNTPLYITQTVHIDETGGRKNAGASVDFEVNYCLKRIIPSTVGFKDYFFYPQNESISWIRTALIIWQIICLLLVVGLIWGGVRKQKVDLKKERIQKELVFNDERNAFIKSLEGRSLQQAASVPHNISFVNGFPKDNNDSEYGSFTVYCSTNGKCYHEKKGCCSAKYAVNYIAAIENHYKPCSKCCKKHLEVPEWYVKYSALKSKAEQYKVEYTE